MSTTEGPVRNDKSSLSALLSSLVSDITGLFRKEIELAKTEANEKLSSVVHGGQMIVIGAILGVGALGVLLAAIVTALGAWFAAMGMSAILANSLAALIVAVVVGGIGWGMISSGLNKLKQGNLKLTRTAGSISGDVDAIKERF